MKKFAIVIVLFSAILLMFACGKKGNVKPDGTKSLEAGIYKKGKNVMFVYKASKTGVKSVSIRGDFHGSGSKAIPLEFKDGTWRVVLKLEYGIYQYKYIINGEEEVIDPAAEAYAPDGKGGKNCIIEVAEEE